ncbi:unnamed protein product [Ectocarpus sp. 4 AP-2014]
MVRFRYERTTRVPLDFAENPLSSCNSKHIDVRHHFLRNLTEEGVLEIRHVSSEG